jgi:hypothetical protein
MRAVSLHPGVTGNDVARATSFDVHGLADAEPTRLPNGDELDLIHDVIDPKGLRDKEVKA